MKRSSSGTSCCDDEDGDDDDDDDDLRDTNQHTHSLTHLLTHIHLLTYSLVTGRLVEDVLGDNSSTNSNNNNNKVPMEKVVMLIWQFRDDPSVITFMARFMTKVRIVKWGWWWWWCVPNRGKTFWRECGGTHIHTHMAWLTLDTHTHSMAHTCFDRTFHSDRMDFSTSLPFF